MSRVTHTRRAPLEPLSLVLIAVIVAHVLVGLGLWTFLPALSAASLKPVFEGWTWGKETRYWFDPASFHNPADTPAAPAEVTQSILPTKTVPGSTPDTQAQVGEKQTAVAKTSASQPTRQSPPALPMVEVLAQTRTVNKVITLSPVGEAVSAESPNKLKSHRPTITLLDVLKHEEKPMETTDEANMDPVLKALEASLKREWNAPAIDEVPVANRDAKLAVGISRSGDVLEVQMAKPSGSAKLDQSVLEAGMRVKKISESLPSSFPKDRYNVEVNFHIE